VISNTFFVWLVDNNNVDDGNDDDVEEVVTLLLSCLVTLKYNVAGGFKRLVGKLTRAK
jgi:hypothetical protein